MTAVPNPRTVTVRNALGGIDLAADVARALWLADDYDLDADPEGAGQ